MTSQFSNATVRPSAIQTMEEFSRSKPGDDRVERMIKALVTQVSTQIWHAEAKNPRYTGLWLMSIDDAKMLDKILAKKMPMGFSYVPASEVLGPDRSWFGTTIKENLFLIVYYPWTQPKHLLALPRKKDEMFPTGEPSVAHVLPFVPLAPHSIPMLPPNICAKCSEPARHRCARCQMVFYCGAACQRADYKKHKPGCSSVRCFEPYLNGTGTHSSGTFTEDNFPTYAELEANGVTRLSPAVYDKVKERFLGTAIPERKKASQAEDLNQGFPWHYRVVARAIEYDL